MVESINQVGHVMGLQTIAEHVESRQVMAKLCEFQVDYAQGFAVSEPMSVEDWLNRVYVGGDAQGPAAGLGAY